MRWFSFGNGSRDDPVHIVQQALSGQVETTFHCMIDALDTIIREQLWRAATPFESFAEFAVALPPSGLGVRSLRPLKLFALRSTRQWPIRALDGSFGAHRALPGPATEKSRQ